MKDFRGKGLIAHKDTIQLDLTVIGANSSLSNFIAESEQSGIKDLKIRRLRNQRGDVSLPYLISSLTKSWMKPTDKNQYISISENKIIGDKNKLFISDKLSLRGARFK